MTNGSYSSQDVWTDLAIDNKGRIHVTGFCTREATGADILTRTYNASGTRLWQGVFATSGVDIGMGIAVDSAGCTYIGGWCDGGGEDDAVVIKYGADGSTMWRSTYPDTARYPTEVDKGDDWAVDVAVAGDNVYAVGAHEADHSGIINADFLTIAMWR